jgi:hypothetical protein
VQKRFSILWSLFYEHKLYEHNIFVGCLFIDRALASKLSTNNLRERCQTTHLTLTSLSYLNSQVANVNSFSLLKYKLAGSVVGAIAGAI